MQKIPMPNPIAELDGDEMTRVLWRMIKETLLLPFVDLNTEYYDLSLPHRDETRDQVTRDAAEAIRRLHVGVKCATITPNAKRMEEYHLHEMWKSPNGTIRAALDGTVFRAPILTSRITPHVSNWKKPITIARHAYGDIYRANEYRVPGPGKATLTFEGEDGTRWSETVFDFRGPGVRALPSRWTGSRISGSPPRTRSQSSTTAPSATFSKTSIRRSTKPPSTTPGLPISIP